MHPIDGGWKAVGPAIGRLFVAVDDAPAPHAPIHAKGAGAQAPRVNRANLAEIGNARRPWIARRRLADGHLKGACPVAFPAQFHAPSVAPAQNRAIAKEGAGVHGTRGQCDGSPRLNDFHGRFSLLGAMIAQFSPAVGSPAEHKTGPGAHTGVGISRDNIHGILNSRNGQGRGSACFLAHSPAIFLGGGVSERVHPIGAPAIDHAIGVEGAGVEVTGSKFLDMADIWGKDTASIEGIRSAKLFH